MEAENFQKKVLREVILAYRRTIDVRYQYEHLMTMYEMPVAFNQERVQHLRDYFLNYIYPHPDLRTELDDAFHSLDNYIKQPEKLLRLLLDSGRLIFRYGRHLPKILKTGLGALRSFRAATHFESELVKQAIQLNLSPPYDLTAINKMLRALPRAEMEQFIINSQSLFETLHDRVLVKKIIEIVEYLIKKMEERPQIYSSKERRGLEIGRDIIKNGDAIFHQLSLDDQRQIFDLIIKIERGVIKDLFEK